MSAGTTGPEVDSDDPARPARSLCVTGVEGRIAREVLRLARERHGPEAVATLLRTPGKSPSPIRRTGEAAEAVKAVETAPVAEAVQTPQTADTPAVLQAPPAPQTLEAPDDAPPGHDCDPAHRDGRDEAPGSGYPVVVCVGLSTDLHIDLRVEVAVRRAGLAQLVRSAAASTQRGGHLLVVTSARVYGARPGNPVPIPPHAPLQARDDGGLVGDLLAVEAEVDRIRRARPDLHVTVVRPAAVVGPGVDSTITRHFESSRLLVLGGSAPLWQFLHVEDLATAILAVTEHAPVGDLGPVVTVGNPDPLSQQAVERLSGRRRLELPAAAALATARRLNAAGLLITSGTDLDYVRYPWVVGSDQLSALGWAPRYDNEACLRAMLDQLHGRTLAALRRDATVGTASAAVALVGTAALMRRRRRKGA